MCNGLFPSKHNRIKAGLEDPLSNYCLNESSKGDVFFSFWSPQLGSQILQCLSNFRNQLIGLGCVGHPVKDCFEWGSNRNKLQFDNQEMYK